VQQLQEQLERHQPMSRPLRKGQVQKDPAHNTIAQLLGHFDQNALRQLTDPLSVLGSVHKFGQQLLHENHARLPHFPRTLFLEQKLDEVRERLALAARLSWGVGQG
jgi:hypothetical protein